MSNTKELIQTIMLAMVPIAELRVAIPIAIVKFGINPTTAYLASVFGNLVPVIFILYLLEAVSNFLIKRFVFWKKFFDWLFSRTRNKLEKNYQIYGCVALAIFVAIPLPATGAWTGSAAAYLFGIPKWKAFVFISLGVATAGVIVTLASLGILSIF